MKNNFILKGMASTLLLVMLSTTGWSAGVIFNANGTGGSGFVFESGSTKLNAGNALQFIKGGKSSPNPSSNYLSGGNQLLGEMGKVGEGTADENGTFNRVESTATGTVYVRAWNTPAPGQGPNIKYGYSAYGSASSGTAPPQAFPVPSFNLNYTAYAPGSPTLLAVAKGDIGYDTAKLKWSFKPGYEVTGVTIFYGTKKLDANTIDTSTGGTIVLSGAPSSYKFPSYPNKNALAPNNTYYAQVTAKNYFAGTPGKSNLVSFSTIAVPASEVGKAKNLSIKANQNDNSVTLSYEGVNATEFEIFRSSDQGKTWQKISDTTELAYTDKENSPDVPVVYYRVRAKEGVFAEATVARAIFKFNKLEKAGKKYTGINSFSIPFLPNGKAVAKADRWELTADGFSNYIKKIKGDVVESIGGWDETNQKSYGRLYKAGAPFSGAAAAYDFKLGLKHGYQIAISKSIEILIIGEVSGRNE